MRFALVNVLNCNFLGESISTVASDPVAENAKRLAAFNFVGTVDLRCPDKGFEEADSAEISKLEKVAVGAD